MFQELVNSIEDEWRDSGLFFSCCKIRFHPINVENKLSLLKLCQKQYPMFATPSLNHLIDLNINKPPLHSI